MKKRRPVAGGGEEIAQAQEQISDAISTSPATPKQASSRHDAVPPTDVQFNHTIAAVAEADKGQWRIGDALQEDLENAFRGGAAPRAVYRKCAEQLVAYDRYEASYLAKLHRTARAFGHNERDPDLSWDAHYEARSPENLRRAAATLRDLSKSVTGRNVRWLMDHWRAEFAAQSREQHEAAKAAAAEAKQKVKAAAEKKLQSGKDKAAREQAERERQEAKRELAEARRRKEETASPPPFNADVTTPRDSPLRVWIAFETFDLCVERFDRDFRGVQKLLKEIGGRDNLTSVQVQHLVTNSKHVMRQLQEFIAWIGSPRDRFQVVRDSDDGTSPP